MNPCELVRQATSAVIDLCVQDGRLILESPTGPPPRELLDTITANKRAIVACLEEFASNAEMRSGYVQRVAHLPALSRLERQEAEALAAELAASGGIGQFALCLCAGWHALEDGDRLAAVTVWQLVAGDVLLERAA